MLMVVSSLAGILHNHRCFSYILNILRYMNPNLGGFAGDSIHSIPTKLDGDRTFLWAQGFQQ